MRSSMHRGFRTALAVGALALVLASGTVLSAADEKAAEKALADARKAFVDKNYPTAVQRYKDFLAKYADSVSAPTARFGLAESLLELPEPDLAGALEQLQMLAGAKDAPAYPYVLYQLAVAQRGLGAKEKARAATVPPQDAGQLIAAANQRFVEAGKQFAAAAQAYAARAKKPDDPEAEWAIRSRLNQLEMLLLTDNPKEAQAVVAPLLKDPAVGKGRHLRLALYYDGWSRFLLKDYLGAGRALSTIAAFGDADFGTHARYLLARIHHLEDERAEAIGHYEGLLGDYEAHKKNAMQVLQRPDLLKNDAKQKARLQALVKGAPPEHVARTQFHIGVIQAEGGRFADAQARFVNYLKLNPKSPIGAECQLRLGICFVQLKQWAEAAKTLQPLVAREPALADQTLYWLAKASAGSADPANPAVYQQALKGAVDTFKQAAAKAKEREADDADARSRRGLYLLDMGDTQQLAGQHKDAAATYQQVLADKLLPRHEAELLQREAAALNLAGDFDASDKVCERFQRSFPQSPFLPAVMYRYAENAGFRLAQAEKNAQLPNREKELARLGEDAAKRAQTLLTRFPEFEYGNLLRYGIGLALLGKGELAKAVEVFKAIPSSDRKDDLTIVSYLQADCLLRLAPTKTDDALSAGKAGEMLAAAVEQLDGFVSAQPKGPLVAQALLRLGQSSQRVANLQTKAEERAKFLTAARVAYKRIYAEYPQDPSVSVAKFEEARCFVGLNAVPRAITNLQAFSADPLRQSPIAPMALLQLATILRAQNKAADGATLLGQAREMYGPTLAKDAARAGWLPLLQLHQGICLREAGKLPEARALFEALLKDFPAAPEAAEAALRRGQCLREEVLPSVEKVRPILANPMPKPEEAKVLAEVLKALTDAAGYLEAEAGKLKDKPAAIEVRTRMLYDAAWAYRTIAEAEIAAARVKLQQEQKKEVPLAQVPAQPAEKKLRDLYQAAIAAAGELPLGVDARLELGEVLAERGDPAGAIKLFADALDQEPTPDMTDKLRLRLAAALAAKGDAKAAQGQFEAVAGNNKSPLAGVARQQVQALMQNKPLPPLPLYGVARIDRASLEDPTANAPQVVAAAAPLPAQRQRPAPFMRLSVPDPYEFHYIIRVPATTADDVMPLPGVWPIGS